MMMESLTQLEVGGEGRKTLTWGFSSCSYSLNPTPNKVILGEARRYRKWEFN